MKVILFYYFQALCEDTNLAMIGQLMLGAYFSDNANLLQIGSISYSHYFYGSLSVSH